MQWDYAALPSGNSVEEDEEHVNRLLQEGWEPFAATITPGGTGMLHMRLMVLSDVLT